MFEFRLKNNELFGVHIGSSSKIPEMKRNCEYCGNDLPLDHGGRKNFLSSFRKLTINDAQGLHHEKHNTWEIFNQPFNLKNVKFSTIDFRAEPAMFFI